MFKGLLRRRRALSVGAVALLATALAPVVPPALSPAVADPGATTEQAGAGPTKPVILTEADGRLTLFARKAGELWRRDRDTSRRWGQWARVHPKARTHPTVARLFDGRPVVFVVHTDGSLQYQVRTGGTWQKWARMPGLPDGVELDSTPAVVANNDTIINRRADNQHAPQRTDGRLEIFVRGSDGRLWHTTEQGNSQLRWTPWQRRGTGLAGNPTAAVGGDGTIGVFSRGTGGKVRYRLLQPTSGGRAWSSWQVIGKLGQGRFDVTVAVNSSRARGSLFQVFADGANGRLWTVTQAYRNRHAWTDRDQQPLFGGALRGAPAVVAGADGRLTVFGQVGPGSKLRWRGQASTARPELPDSYYHNGVWGAPCCGTGLSADPTFKTVTAFVGGQNRIEVFGLAANGNLRYLSQLVAGTVEKPEGWWLKWGNLNPVNNICGVAGTIDCLTMASAKPEGHLLKVDPNPNGSLVTEAPMPGDSSHQWQFDLLNEEGIFMIRNRDKGSCLESRKSSGFPFTVRKATVRDCDASLAEQQWFLIPVMAEGDVDKNRHVPDRFKIGSVWNPDDCLRSSQRFWFCSDSEVDSDMVWTLGRNGRSAPGTMDLAMERAAALECMTPEEGNCVFNDAGGYEDIYPTVGCVASAVAYNPPNATRPFEGSVTWTRLSGSEHSFGVTGGGSVGFGEERRFGLSVAFEYSHTWVEQDGKEERYTFKVGKGMFGWLEVRPLLRRTTGHWEVTTSDRTWTVAGENVSFAIDTRKVDEIITTVQSTSPPTQDKCPHGTNPVVK